MESTLLQGAKWRVVFIVMRIQNTEYNIRITIQPALIESMNILFGDNMLVYYTGLIFIAVFQSNIWDAVVTNIRKARILHFRFSSLRTLVRTVRTIYSSARTVS